MQHYVQDQGFVQVIHDTREGAIRLEVHGFKHKASAGEFIYLEPAQAKLIGNQLIAHALRVQADQIKKNMREDDPNVLY
jgi:predicted deacetylase